MKNLHLSENVSYINNNRLKHAVGNINMSETIVETTVLHNGAFMIDVKFSAENKRALLDSVQETFSDYHTKEQLYSVGKTGLKDNKDVGSKRFCIQSKDLSYLLEDILYQSGVFDGVFQYKEDFFSYCGVSNYFRFMTYRKGGEHFPHYDSDFVYEGTDRVSKMSLVMYFTDNETGKFCFVKENEVNNPYKNDWSRQADDEEIDIAINPKIGRILVFPHDLCHTVMPLIDENIRTMVRGDVVFEKLERKNTIL